MLRTTKGIVAVGRKARQASYCHSATSPAALSAGASAYVHLPFCKKKCLYCDFPVEALGTKSSSVVAEQKISDYVSWVCKEIKLTCSQGSSPLRTIYFGGGTPSLVPPHLLSKILAALDQHIGIRVDAEISLEADPGTFDSLKINEYAALGVNRLSVGVQSFQEELLRVCGRSHTLQEVHDAIHVVQNGPIKAWSLDLICGLPTLTSQAWKQSIEKAIASGAPHISVYDLQVEEGTPFARLYTPGRAPLPLEDEAAEMYSSASTLLQEAGFEHYEVSSYARPGMRCEHNQVYWDGRPYFAFGLGAASYRGGRRFSRPRSMKHYLAWVDELGAAGGVPGGHMAPETLEERMLDTIMLRLRTSDGLDLEAFADSFGTDSAQRVMQGLQPFVEQGLVSCTPKSSTLTAADRGSGKGLSVGPRVIRCQGNEDGSGTAGVSRADVPVEYGEPSAADTSLPRSVRLVDPQGFLLSNSIISSVFADLDKKSV